MSTFRNITKATLIAASLLLAAAASAGDVTSDRAQAAANAKPGAAEKHRTSGDAPPAEAKACYCAPSAPKRAPEKALLDDPDFTGYRPG